MSGLVYFFIIFFYYFTCKQKYQYGKANSVDPDRTPLCAASDQDLHCLRMSFYGFVRFLSFELSRLRIAEARHRRCFSCVVVGGVNFAEFLR